MPELTMPRLSDTMQEGTIARWLKKQGDSIASGETVAEIETDKATMPLEAYDTGVLERILVQEGQTVAIGQPIAVIGTGEGAAAEPAAPEGEATVAETAKSAAPGATSARGQTQDAQREGQAPANAAAERPGAQPGPSVRPGQPDQEPVAPDGRNGATEDGAAEDEEVKASPMARAIARERGVDLHTVIGSGPGGRIIRADVEAAAAAAQGPSTERVPVAPSQAAPPAQGPAKTPAELKADGEDIEEIPLSNVRRVIARRMVESVQSAPHFYLTSVVDAEALVDFRKTLNERLPAAGQSIKFSLNDLIVKACAISLRANPDVNASFGGDRLLRYKRAHVGFAVALESGLIVPVIRDADLKSLSEIARDAQSLIEKARSGKLAPDEFRGSTFTVSNLGMFGIDHFTAIINPPEGAILAVGAARPEPVARDGQVVVRHTMKMTLSCDHRVVDGATGARFLQHLQSLLEEPLRIVV